MCQVLSLLCTKYTHCNRTSCLTYAPSFTFNVGAMYKLLTHLLTYLTGLRFRWCWSSYVAC